VKRIALLFVAAGASAGVAFACGSSSSPGTTAPTPDASTGGDDAGSSADAPSDVVVASTCGPAPWITLGVSLSGITLADLDGSPAPGIEFTSALCPSYASYSDDAGSIEGQISANTPFYGRLQGMGFLSELTPEEIFDASSSGNSLDMYTALLGDLLPGYSAQTAIVLLSVDVLTQDAGACSSPDGVTITVSGHPEAVVTYYTTDALPTPLDGGTATTTHGLASIAGLAGGQIVTLAATKPGCTVFFARPPLTGRTPLETGYASLMPIYLSP
jgi:hypothetical protein